MDQNTANNVLNTLHGAAFIVDKTLADLKATCPEEKFGAYALLLARVMSDMFLTVIAPIYDEHEDLAPEWYRGGRPAGGPDFAEITAPADVRQALLTAFDAAYEKVQSAMQRVAGLPDPVDVARYSLGLHIISVSICRARLSLLKATIE